MYRPDNPYKLPDEYDPTNPGILATHSIVKLHEGFEAGADAMLEGLLAQPSNRGANVLYVDIEAASSTIWHNPHRKGWLVFIPDEQVK